MDLKHLSLQVIILENFIIKLLLEACNFLLKFFDC